MAQTLSRGPVSGTAVKKDGKRKPFLVDLYSTAVGKKYVMAITGILLLGYVVAHMVGNLKAYQGSSDGVYALDTYAVWLKELLYPAAPKTAVLWLMRSGLIVAVLLHIHAAYGLTILNRRARAVKYQSARDYEVANFASRTMRWTGIIVALFVLWHLADFTFGWVNPGFESGAVHRNLVASFEQVPVSIFYIVANIALGIHLFHGIWSMFQSMGWNNPRFNAWRRPLATAIATVIVVGNVSFPIAVLAGIIEHPAV